MDIVINTHNNFRNKLIGIPDIYMNVVKNVDSFSDLVKLCNTSVQTRIYCSKYQSEYFFNLIKKQSFMTTYYNKFNKIINSQNNHDFRKILNYYPVGRFYGKNYDIINKLQILIFQLGTSIENFINMDSTIKNTNQVRKQLDKTWKNLIHSIFFPSHFLINLNLNKENESDNLSRLSNLSQFDLVFNRDSHLPFGFWDIKNLISINDLLKIIFTGKINTIYLTIDNTNFEEIIEEININTNMSNPFQSFLDETNISKSYDNTTIDQIQNTFLDFLIFHLDIYKKSDNESFKNISTILIKQIVYSSFVDDDDIMYDFLQYAQWSLNLLFTLHNLDKIFVTNIVKECFLELGGNNLQNYSEIEDNPTYPYFKKIYNHFISSTTQIGGKVRSKSKTVVRSKCKSQKISQVMGEFKNKTLKTRWGQPVKNPKQAIAIGLSIADKYCSLK